MDSKIHLWEWILQGWVNIQILKHIYVEFCQVFYLKSNKKEQVIIAIRVLPVLIGHTNEWFLKYISNSDNVACTAVTDLGRTKGWN